MEVSHQSRHVYTKKIPAASRLKNITGLLWNIHLLLLLAWPAKHIINEAGCKIFDVTYKTSSVSILVCHAVIDLAWCIAVTMTAAVATAKFHWYNRIQKERLIAWREWRPWWQRWQRRRQRQRREGYTPLECCIGLKVVWTTLRLTSKEYLKLCWFWGHSLFTFHRVACAW